MIDLDEVPPFASLPRAARDGLARRLAARHVPAGDVILRRGQAGRSLFLIESGLVSLGDQWGGSSRLGTGETFGELTGVSGLPVSRQARAVKDTVLLSVAEEELEPLWAKYDGFRRALVQLSARGERRAREARPSIAFVSRQSQEQGDLPRALVRAAGWCVRGGVELLDAGLDPAAPEVVAARLSEARLDPSLDLVVVDLGTQDLERYERLIGPGDAVLHVRAEREGGAETSHIARRIAQGDHAVVRILQDSRSRPDVDERWHFRVTRDEVARHAREGSGRPGPALASLARWSTRQWVGIALSAGAARGFAHLGVLAALEKQGVPVDVVAGTSIGGIVGLLYGLSGSAGGALELARETIGRNELVWRMRWVPRSSLFSGRTLEDRARRIAGGRSFADLSIPVRVVACDLARGERFTLDRGLVAPALVATSAIPGALPPVEHAGRLLVDGALVQRVPVELLETERCGVRIAVNVLPPPAAPGWVAPLDGWRARFGRVLGFRSVVARSWEILSWRRGADDATGADVLIEPQTGSESGFDFDAIQEMIRVGRVAAEEQLPLVQRLIAAQGGPPGEAVPRA